MIRCLWSSFRFQLKTNHLRSKNSHVDVSQKLSSKETQQGCDVWSFFTFTMFWFSCCVTHPTYKFVNHLGSNSIFADNFCSFPPSPKQNGQSMRLHLLIKLIAGSLLWRICFILRLSLIKTGRTNGKKEKKQGTHGPVEEVIVFRGGEKGCSLGCHRIIGHGWCFLFHLIDISKNYN